MRSFLEEDFNHVASSLQSAAQYRGKRQERMVPFGISYLDDCFGGIYPNDLMLIGAQTGRGKTQLATHIASKFAAQGKKVFYFALEAFKHEIELRMIFSEMRQVDDVDYWQYMRGDRTPLLLQAEENAIERLKSKTENLYIFYKSEDFTTDDLEKRLTELQSIADVFIIDHFHFFDFNPKETEVIAHKNAIKKIGFLVKSLGVPVILLAHLNKAYSKSERVIPNEYDFYGTSDLVNIATKVLLISDQLPEALGLGNAVGTVFYAAKQRENMAVRRHFGVLSVDPRTGEYGKKYYLGETGSEKLAQKPFPSWAMNAKEARPYVILEKD